MTTIVNRREKLYILNPDLEYAFFKRKKKLNEFFNLSSPVIISIYVAWAFQRGFGVC